MYPKPGENADSEILDDWTEDELINRPRGILSPKERAHLFGRLDEDLKDDAAAIRQREYRIRQHIRNAFIDFQSAGCRELTKNVLSDEIGSDLDGYHGALPLHHGVKKLIGVLYSALGAPRGKNVFSTYNQMLQEAVGDLLVRSYAQEGVSVAPRVSVEIDLRGKISIDELSTFFEQHDPQEATLLPQELDTLREAGEISIDQANHYASTRSKEKEMFPDHYEKKIDDAFHRRQKQSDGSVSEE